MADGQIRDMQDDELAAALQAMYADEQPPEGEQPQEDPQGVSVPQPLPDEQAPPIEEPIPPQQPQGGDLNVALRQEREHRRQIEEHNRQLQQAIQDPETLRQLLGQYEPQQQPELAIEDPEVISRLIQQAIAPYVQEVQQLKAVNHQTQAEKQALEMRQNNPDFDDAVNAVDQQMPHLANLPPQEKHLVGQGLLYRDPAYLQQKIAQQLAAAKEAGQKEALGKLTQPTIKGPDGLARAGSVTPGQDKPKTNDRLTDDELYQKRREIYGA